MKTNTDGRSYRFGGMARVIAAGALLLLCACGHP